MNKTATVSMKAWSDEEQKVKTLAVYQILPEGLVYITPDDNMRSYFDNLGLDKRGERYLLNLDFAPSGMVAKTFGMDFNDNEVREQIMERTNSFSPTGREIFAVAYEGIPSQMGRIVTNDERIPHFKTIPKAALLSSGSGMTLQDQYVILGKSKVAGLAFEEVLLDGGKRIEHAYIVKPTTNDKAGRDRLAMYLAAVDGMGQIPGVNADTTVGMRFTKEMEPALLMIDKSKPPINVIDQVTVKGHACIRVSNEEYSAKRAMMPAEAHLSASPVETFKNYIKATSMKRLCTKAEGFHTSTPKLVGNALYGGRVFVSANMDIDSYLLRLKSQVEKVDQDVSRLFRMHQGEMPPEQTARWEATSQEFADEIISQMEAVALNATAISKSMEDLLVRHAGSVYEAEDKREKAKYREYTVKGLEA